MIRRRGPAGVVALSMVLVVLGAGASCRRRPELPSGAHPIIILDLDTLRADHLGCYGYHRPTSPNLDALAAAGVRFEWAFAQAPYTAPSQTSILTSLYPGTHRMISHEDRVSDSVITLAEAMRGSGFLTVAFVDDGFMSPAFNIDQGFQLFDTTPVKGLRVIGPKVMRWIRDNAHENFLLLVHTYDTHSPYAPPAPYRSMFMEALQPPSPGFEPTTKVLRERMLAGRRGELNTLPDNDIEYMRALYDGEIRFVDAWVGAFMAELEALGLRQRSTVIVLSDHGEEFQEHGSVLHEKLYATVTHIPLIVRLPGSAGPRVVHDVVQAIDVMPTVLELVGAPLPPGMQGRSLVPLLTGAPISPGRAFGESPFFGRERFFAEGSFQLMARPDLGQVELYDLTLDPHEQHDLAAARPELVEALMARVREQAAGVESAPSSRPPDPTLDPDVVEQLRGLGYLE